MTVSFGIDIGTSKISIVAIDTDSFELLSIHSEANEFCNSDNRDKFEQHPDDILRKCFSLISKAISDIKRQPDYLGITGQMHGIVLVDNNLAPQSNLITWQDRTSNHIVSNLAGKQIDSKQYTGCDISAGFGGAILSRLSSENFLHSGLKALTIADFLYAKLCGTLCTDITNAAGFGIFDLQNRRWSQELLQVLDIPAECLPPVAADYKLTHPLSSSAEQIGLSNKVRICNPLGDNQASFLGATNFSTAPVVINLGTGGQISYYKDSFSICANLQTRPMPFGGFLYVGTTEYSGAAWKYLKNFFQQVFIDFANVHLPDALIYEKMNILASSVVSSGCDLWASTNFSVPQTGTQNCGAIYNVSSSNFTPSNLLYAFANSLIDELAVLVDSKIIRERKLYACGNAVRKNSALLRMIKRRFSKNIKLGKFPEEAAIGAALVAVRCD